MKNPTTGELRHRLAVEVEQRVEDASGGYSTAWASLGGMWAKLVEGSPSEKQSHGITNHAQGVLVLARVSPVYGMTSQNVDKHRFTYRGEAYKILSMRPLGMRLEFVVFGCERLGAVATAGMNPDILVPLGTITPDEW